jgi:hypothetical protein
MTTEQVLADLQSGKIDLGTATKLLAEITNKKNATKVAGLTFKVSAKKALSVYGLGRWPTTLYKGQWARLIEKIKDGSLEKFIEQHPELSEGKEEEAEKPAAAPASGDFGGVPVAA